MNQMLLISDKTSQHLHILNVNDHRTVNMEEHPRFHNRFCENELTSKYKVNSFVEEVNYCYRTDKVDIQLDDPNCQSQFLCQSCYKTLKKCQEKLKFRKKNLKSNKQFKYAMPPYKENVNVHLSIL